MMERKKVYCKFQPEWAIDFLCSEHGGDALCLLCGKHLVMKKSSVKRHYDKFHANEYENVIGEDRQELLAELHKKIHKILFPDPSEGEDEETPSVDLQKVLKGRSEDKEEAAFSFMKAVCEKNLQNDEFSAFGELIAHKIRNLKTERLQKVSQHELLNKLFEIEMQEAKLELQS